MHDALCSHGHHVILYLIQKINLTKLENIFKGSQLYKTQWVLVSILFKIQCHVTYTSCGLHRKVLKASDLIQKLSWVYAVCNAFGFPSIYQSKRT